LKNIAIAVFGLMAVSCIQSNSSSNHDQTGTVTSSGIKEPSSPGNPIIPIDPPVVTPIEPPEVKPTVKEVSDRSLISKDSTYEVYGTIDGCGHSKEGWIISSDSTKTKFPVIKQGIGMCTLSINSVKVSNKYNEYQYLTPAEQLILIAKKSAKTVTSIDTYSGVSNSYNNNVNLYMSKPDVIEGTLGTDFLYLGFAQFSWTLVGGEYRLNIFISQDNSSDAIGTYTHKDVVTGEYQSTVVANSTGGKYLLEINVREPERIILEGVSTLKINGYPPVRYDYINYGYVFNLNSISGNVSVKAKNADGTRYQGNLSCGASIGLWGSTQGVISQSEDTFVIDPYRATFEFRNYYGMTGFLFVASSIPYNNSEVKTLSITVRCFLPDGSSVSKVFDVRS
jgi:hypothetical protein